MIWLNLTFLPSRSQCIIEINKRIFYIFFFYHTYSLAPPLKKERKKKVAKQMDKIREAHAPRFLDEVNLLLFQSILLLFLGESFINLCIRYSSTY